VFNFNIPKRNVQTNAIPIRGDGTHKIEFYAEDTYGNVESKKTEIYKIDSVKPDSLDITLDYVDPIVGPVIATITASDQHSGIKQIQYWFDRNTNYAQNYTNEPITITHSRYLTCVAIDYADNQISTEQYVSMTPKPTPPQIRGPHEVKPGMPYVFNFTSTDHHNPEELRYYIEWGDGEIENWIGPYVSGETVTLTHVWSAEEEITIKAKAKNALGATSDESKHVISVAKSKSKSILYFIEDFIAQFPLIQKLIAILTLIKTLQV
jgi:hypothetical protein